MQAFYVQRMIYRYLDCGVLKNGFARLPCGDCGHEFLLAFSCKRRHFCPSCHHKRVMAFGEWLCREVVKTDPLRHVVFSIPKILRRYFLHDRKLLSALSKCSWEALKTLHKSGLRDGTTIPGEAVAIQTFGDCLGYNPHLHILVSDGCFHGSGMFSFAPPLDTKPLAMLFRQNVLKMLLLTSKFH
jgi:hypothetical protein